MRFFKQKTRQEKMQLRVNSVFSVLVSDIECEFSDLETVQILNEVRRKYAEHLQSKKADCLSLSTDMQNKAAQISEVLQFIE